MHIRSPRGEEIREGGKMSRRREVWVFLFPSFLLSSNSHVTTGTMESCNLIGSTFKTKGTFLLGHLDTIFRSMRFRMSMIMFARLVPSNVYSEFDLEALCTSGTECSILF